MSKFLAGTVCGLILSVAYVWYDIELPDWVKLPGTLQQSLRAAATDDTLFDLEAPAEMRRRALEIFFTNQARKASVLDAELGHPLMSELMRRRAQRRATVLRGLWSAYDKALEKPMLRDTLVRKHGALDNTALKRSMLLAALLEEKFLTTWIKRNHGPITETTVL
ncbi:MAG: hypothetical protein AAGJ70_03700, partial [Pseudomonadota bacterium]